MANWNHPFYSFIRSLDQFSDRLRIRLIPRKFLWRNQATEIKLFNGYGHRSAVHISGRVLLYKKPPKQGKISAWRQFRATLDLFNSREIIGALVRLDIGKQSFELLTDREGYFHLKTSWEQPVFQEGTSEVTIKASLLFSPYGKYNGVEAQATCYLITPEQKLGLITDIDDTILKTGVTSRFMWRAIYATFFEDLTKRKSIPDSASFIKTLRKESILFYVSNSPWNIFPFLFAFLERNDFPDGPILLRDLGIPVKYTDPRPHKIKTISRILELYPDTPFVLLGDSGENDAAYYQELDLQYPGRILHKLIRKVPGSTVRLHQEGLFYFEEYKELESWWIATKREAAKKGMD